MAVAGYQSFWFFTQWKYDSWNRIQEITYPDQEVVSYSYNEAGALNAVNSQITGLTVQPIVTDIKYTDYGERASITHGNGTTTAYTYDARRRMNNLSHNFSNAGFNITKSYSYDQLSNITKIQTQTPQNSMPGTGKIGGPILHNYKYDDYNRLINADGNYTGANDLTTPYLYTDYTLNIQYNTDHTISKKSQNQRQGTVPSYGGAVSDERAVEKTSYILDYSGYGTGAYVVSNTNNPNDPNAYGYQQPHAVRTIVETPSWVEDIAPDDPRIRHKNLYYDANGNQTEIKETVGALTMSLRKNLWDEENRLKAVNLKPDDPTGHPIAIYTYDAGGARTVRYNYYDPKLSIFISVDPLAEKTMSAYGYCYNNPIMYTDPNGKSPIFDYDGNYLGNDNEGFNGAIIFMDKSEYNRITTDFIHPTYIDKSTDGSAHRDAISHDVGTRIGKTYDKMMENQQFITQKQIDAVNNAITFVVSKTEDIHTKTSELHNQKTSVWWFTYKTEGANHMQSIYTKRANDAHKGYLGQYSFPAWCNPKNNIMTYNLGVDSYLSWPGNLTVANVQNLYVHEDGHLHFNIPGDGKGHVQAYDLQINHSSWIMTTPDHQKAVLGGRAIEASSKD